MAVTSAYGTLIGLFLNVFMIATSHGMPRTFNGNFMLPNKPFVSVWNAPSASCSERHGVHLDLSMFDIIANKNQSFEGDDMVLFYKLGLFPSYNKNGTAENGGLPQLANLSAHFMEARNDILQLIPNSSFTGLSVIDWEAWTPLLSGSPAIYRKKSENYVRSRHPSWNSSQVAAEAQKEFDAAARVILEGTLNLGRLLRPGGRWGYYGYPRCWSTKPGTDTCPIPTSRANDKFGWLFAMSTGGYPSIYLKTPQITKGVIPGQFVRSILKEALRVRANFSNDHIPIMPYTLFRFQDNATKYYKDLELAAAFIQSSNAGVAGLVLWDGSRFYETRANCESLKQYLDTKLGPLIRNISVLLSECSINLCNGHGRCVLSNWTTHDVVDLPASRQSDNVIYDKEQRFFEENNDVPFLKFLTRKSLNEFEVFPRRTLSQFKRVNVMKTSWYKIMKIREKFRPAIRKAPTYVCQCYEVWKGEHCDQTIDL